MNKELLGLFNLEQDIDERSAAFLTRAIAENDLPGFDYLEFKKAMAALKAMQMDEDTAIRSSYATASVAGLSKDKLIQAANHYLQVLSKEKDQFASALQDQFNLKVQQRKERMDFLKGGVEDGLARIEKIKAKIAELQTELSALEDEVEGAVNGLKETESKFVAAYNTIEAQIKNDISKFNEIL